MSAELTTKDPISSEEREGSNKPSGKLGRRALMLGAAAGVGAAASLAVGAQPAGADGTPVELGDNNTATGTTVVVKGASSGIGGTAALVGDSDEDNGVYGASSDYSGVVGRSVGNSGLTSTAGVVGDSTTNEGVLGSSSDESGVHGVSVGASGITGNTAGVLGDSNSYDGVTGLSSGGNGVSGYSTGGTGGGVYGQSQGHTAKKATGAESAGVAGVSDTYTGVAGVSSGGYGVYGATFLEGSSGVIGVDLSDGGVGVSAQSTSGTALQVEGVATFTRSGVVSIAAGKSTATHSGVPLTSTSLVLGTLQNSVSGVYVEAVVPNVSGHSFEIVLSKAVPSGKTAKVAWFVVN